MQVDFPQITVLIPTLNEEDYIEQCIRSVLDNEAVAQNIEILVIDGGSTDSTKDKVLKLSETYSQLKLLDNPRKIVPAALNIGVSNAKHDVLVWLGAHAIYDTDYIKNSVETLINTGAAAVGGVLTAKGRGPFGKALAFATSTKFGIGNAKYRYATKMQSVDTVFGGCWKKETVLKAGGFNEQWVRNQDFEFNQRVRDKVGEIILNPSIRVSYFVRETPRRLAKQYFEYGFWRYKTYQEHPASLGVRQVIPLCLVVSFVLSILVLPVNTTLAVIAPVFYASVVVLVSAFEVIRHQKMKHFLRLLVIYPVLHISWGMGFLWSAIKNRLPF